VFLISYLIRQCEGGISSDELNVHYSPMASRKDGEEDGKITKSGGNKEGWTFGRLSLGCCGV
jgi:hypothetical protein